MTKHLLFDSESNLYYSEGYFDEITFDYELSSVKEMLQKFATVKGRKLTHFLAKSKRHSRYGLSFLDHNKTGYTVFNSIDRFLSIGDSIKIEYDDSEDILLFTSYDHDGHTEFTIAPTTKSNYIALKDANYEEMKAFVGSKTTDYKVPRDLLVCLHTKEGDTHYSIE